MVRILNLSRLELKLKRLPGAAILEIKPAMETTAEDIVRLAKSLVPVDEGTLRDSIGWTWGVPPYGSMTFGRVIRSALGKDLTITIYAGDYDAFYARFVEFGTDPHVNGGLFSGTDHPGTAAQPFFYPSYRAKRKEGKRNIRTAVRNAAKKVSAGS